MKSKKPLLKYLIIKLLFIFVGKGLVAVSKLDHEAKERLKLVPEGLIMTMKVEYGPALSYKKVNGIMKYLGQKDLSETADVVVILKNVNVMLRLLFGQISPALAYAQNSLYVKGDSTELVSIMYALNKLLVYLYPNFMLKKIYIRIPHITRRKVRMYVKLLLKI